MTSPLCPACRERMSSVEAGLVGVWSCLYCEGAWLAAQQANAVAPKLESHLKLLALSGLVDGESLLCPACSGEHFTRFGRERKVVYRCNTCTSAFVPKQTVESNAKTLGGEEWNLGQVLVQAISANPSIAVDGTIGLATLLYLLLS